MIVESGQFSLRLKQIAEAFGLDDGITNAVHAIQFTQYHDLHGDLNYTAELSRDGSRDLPDPLRFIRKRTAILLLDADRQDVWFRGAPGVSRENLAPAPSLQHIQDHAPKKPRHRGRQPAVAPDSSEA